MDIECRWSLLPMETDLGPIEETRRSTMDTHESLSSHTAQLSFGGNVPRVSLQSNAMELLGYKVSHALGEGAFGQVYAGTRVSDALPVAIKTIPGCWVRRDPVNQELPLEVSLMQNVAHVRGVVKLIDACWLQDGNLLIIMERVESCMDLSRFMDEGRLTPQLARSFFRQLVETVKDCHAAGVVHRDIKPENILVDLATESIKLIDFGCASHWEPFYDTLSGTPYYMPPEMFVEARCNGVASEVWSLGVLLYVLATGHFPFVNFSEVTEENVRALSFSQETPVQWQDLIRQLLVFDWTKRPALHDILNHSLLQVEPYDWSRTSTSLGHPCQLGQASPPMDISSICV